MFKDLALYQQALGIKVVGFDLTNPNGLTLEVSAGSVGVDRIGQTFTLASSQSHTFSSHNKWKKRCFMGVISNGTTTDLWVDEFIHDGKTNKSALPSGYTLYLTLAWFEILPGAVDFSESIINRRIYWDEGLL